LDSFWSRLSRPDSLNEYDYRRPNKTARYLNFMSLCIIVVILWLKTFLNSFSENVHYTTYIQISIRIYCNTANNIIICVLEYIVNDFGIFRFGNVKRIPDLISNKNHKWRNLKCYTFIYIFIYAISGISSYSRQIANHGALKNDTIPGIWAHHS